MKQPTATPLAIIGIGCLFPKAGDAQTYWANLREGVDAITDVPATHWRPEDHYDADPGEADMVYAKRGGFLDAVDFAPLDYGIAPRDIEATDTTQLLSLHVAAEALRDAGYGPGQKPLQRDRVGVVLGVTGALELVIPLGARLGHPIWKRALQDAGVDAETAADVVARISDAYVPWQENSFPGLLGNVAAGRIANRLDLHGTNCVVDAACASSLSALHLAALELETHRADMVLAGGVDTFNDVFMYTCFSKTPALSPTGNVRPFAQNADGTMLGEGVGIVAIKRLEDARRDGDQIYAVIKGIGSSSDGKGQAIYAPDAEGQARALRSAYRIAGVSPTSVELVEAHGTGTRVGDATELRGLQSVYAPESDAAETAVQPWCAVGSVKSMIGHTKAAAGVAGLIKTALALRHKVLPPTLNVEEPNEVLGDAGPFYVSRHKRPWLAPVGHPRRAGVSAFGFGGSNFHCVLEESPIEASSGVDWDGRVQILAFAAADRASLARAVRAFDTSGSWAGVRERAARQREAFDGTAVCRLTVAIAQEDDLAQQLANAVKAITADARPRWATPSGIAFGEGPAKGRLAALFGGQGAQRVGMFADLACQFPILRETMETVVACRPAIAQAVFPATSFDRTANARRQRALTCTDVAQPALGAVSLGAARVLQSLGVRFDATVGHSYGELVALCVAGRLSPEELGPVSCRRGDLMAGGEGDRGSMLAVRATLRDLEARLRELGLDGLTIANRNAPEQMVLSGPTAAVERAEAALSSAGLVARKLDVAAAFHSPLVAAARDPFAETLKGLSFKHGTVPVYSNATGTAYPADPDGARALLARQLTSPVEFVRCVEAMVADGVTTFVEVGPGRRLSGLVNAICAEAVATGDVVVTAVDASSGKRHGVADLARCLGAVVAWGHVIDLAVWDPRPAAMPAGKKKLRIPVCGANAKPSVPPRPPRRGTAPTPPTDTRPTMSHPTEPRPTSPLLAASATPATPVAQTPPAAVPSAPVAHAAFATTQANLAALLRLQEQTADLHRRFLDGQEQATRAFGALIAQQQTPMATAGPVGSAALVPVAVAPVAVAPVAVAPVAVAPSTSVAPVSADVAGVLLEIIAAKTGYPASMLELSMGLDADLGIDSIKRVEILSALAERLPHLPKIGPEQLGELQTLGQIVEFLGGAPGASAAQATLPAPAAAPASVETDAIATALLDVVASKTGYPVDMLELDMGLDADLGIDSIKRVEILSALAQRLPSAPTIGPEQLGELTTLAQIVAFLAGGQSSGESAPAAAPHAEAQPATDASVAIDRYTVRFARGVEPGPALQHAAGSLVVTGPDQGAATIAAVLARIGAPARSLAWGDALPPDAAGLVLVAPSQPDPGFAVEALAQLRFASPVLRRPQSAKPILLAVTALGGAFGLENASDDPAGAALCGLVKTASREWPEVHARVLDLPAEASEDLLRTGLAAALREGPVELGCASQGLGTPVLDASEAPGPTGPNGITLAGDDVVVVSGGARGVTAAVVVALARSSGASFLLLGRSPEPGAAPTWLQSDDDEATIKRKLLAEATPGTTPNTTPKEIGRRCTAVVAAREIRATIEAISAAGGRATYRSVDVRDSEAVTEAVAWASANLGPVTALVHGAGVLADRRIEDKTDEDVDRVYGTKVEGAMHLLAALQSAPLRAVVMFSSSTARFGRVGQADYAMANEVLNKLAQRIATERPSVRVLSLGWGPWDGGMVTPALARMFASEGVRTIGLEAGAQFLVDELGRPGAVETVVVGAGSTLDATSPCKDGPPAATSGEARTTAFERELSLSDHPFLRSHVLSGKAVLPTVMMLEWFAHAALTAHPGLCFRGIDNLQVFKGIRLGKTDRLMIRVEAGPTVKSSGQFVVPLELCSGGANGHRVVHARADVVLATEVEAAPTARPLALPKSAWAPEQAYAEALFHGDAFRALKAIDGLAAEGIVVQTKNAPKPSEWMTTPVRRRWVTDPLALDAGLQAMIVWSASQTGAVSLPNRLGSYRQFSEFPAGGAQVSVRITRRSEHAASADLDWTDHAGKVVARLTDCEYTLDAALAAAFARNRLE